MQKTGAELKKARIEQGLSLNEVSMATKINARVLQAMEENTSNKLPAKPFLRGFVKTYAEFLKLNPDDVLKLFEEDLNPTPVPPKPTTEATQTQDKPREKETEKKPKSTKPKKPGPAKTASLKLPFLKEATITKQIFLVIFVIFLIFMIIFVKDVVEKYQSEKQKALTTPVQEQLEPIEPIEPSEPLASKEINKQPESKVQTEETTQAPQPKPEQAKKPEPEPQKMDETSTEKQPTAVEQQIEEKPEEVKSTEQKPTTSEEEDEKVKTTEENKSETEKPAKKPTASLNHEVILEAMDMVNINVVIDEKDEQSFQLQPGKVHVLKGNKLKINFSDAGSVNVIHNGRYLGVPGDLGQSKTVTYP